MTEYVLEEAARRAGGDGGLEKEDSSDSGKNAKLGGQTLFSMCFQNVCYKSLVNHLSVLDECDIEDTTHVQSSSNKTTNPRWRCVQNGILHELLQSDVICIPSVKIYLNPRNI